MIDAFNKGKVVTVQDGLDSEEPLALAFDAVFKILNLLDEDMALPLIANVLAYGLRNRTQGQRAEALEAMRVMVMECVEANDGYEAETLQ